jgi:hypothetical protein
MKEYIVEEGSSARVCLEFEEQVQRPFEVNVTRQLLDDIIDGYCFCVFICNIIDYGFFM